jgi:hypothetical protein
MFRFITFIYLQLDWIRLSGGLLHPTRNHRIPKLIRLVKKKKHGSVYEEKDKEMAVKPPEITNSLLMSPLLVMV